MSEPTRDEIAMRAMQGLLANHCGPIQQNNLRGWGPVNCNHEQIAEVAYLMADAMLKARAALANTERKTS